MKRAQNSVHLISSLISFSKSYDIENAYKKLRKKKTEERCQHPTTEHEKCNLANRGTKILL